MSEPMADDDLADIERGAPFAAPGYDEDIFALVAALLRRRDGGTTDGTPGHHA